MFYKGLCVTALVTSVLVNVVTLQHYGIIPKINLRAKKK